jgi:hypothetical protein
MFLSSNLHIFIVKVRYVPSSFVGVTKYIFPYLGIMVLTSRREAAGRHCITFKKMHKSPKRIAIDKYKGKLWIYFYFEKIV